VQTLHPMITALQHYTQVQGAAQITPEKACFWQHNDLWA
jgi:hypothetical protein